MLYHLAPRTLHGTRLLPLNDLRDAHPALHERHARKYRGREEVMRDRVPGLGCTWGDVLFLTAVPPRVLREAHEEAGFEVPARRWFVIDPHRLEPERTRIYWYRHADRARKFAPENWSAFRPELATLPEATRAHYRTAASEGRRPLAFFRTPHVLYRGVLETTELHVVEV